MIAFPLNLSILERGSFLGEVLDSFARVRCAVSHEGLGTPQPTKKDRQLQKKTKQKRDVLTSRSADLVVLVLYPRINIRYQEPQYSTQTNQ